MNKESKADIRALMLHTSDDVNVIFFSHVNRCYDAQIVNFIAFDYKVYKNTNRDKTIRLE